MRMTISASLGCLVAVLVLGPVCVLAGDKPTPPGPGDAPKRATLYEVAEYGAYRGKNKPSREATATLVGAVEQGAAICPASIADPAAQSCSLVAVATDDILLATGVGPVKGTFWVVLQLDNPVDGAERVVVEGTLEGEIDLSPAFNPKDPVPVGFITGRWTAKGVKGSDVEGLKAEGTFTGTFRLPFEFEFPDPVGTKPAYVVDQDPLLIVPVEPTEYSLGVPTVRLDIDFANN